MAEGDVNVFNQWYVDIMEGVHNHETGDIKLGLIDSVITPTIDDATPMWSAGSGVDYDGNEVTPGGNYSAGGPSFANPAVTVDHANDHAVLDADDITITQHASNPTNARWGIIYNETATNNEAVAYVDLGAVVDLSAGDFTATVHANGIARVGLGTLS